MLAEKGKTDAEIARVLNVSEVTFNAWKKTQAEFLKPLKGWKAKADARVERALYERARGYTHEAEEIFCNTKTGQVTRVSVEKHFPPDTAAAFIWLKNRQGEKWRDKQEVEHTITGINVNIAEKEKV